MNIYDEIDRNRRLTRLFIAAFIVFFLAIGAGMDRYFGSGLRFPLFTALALLIASASSIGAYRYGDRLVLASTSARPADTASLGEREWRDVVDEMSIAAGMPAPAVFVVDDPSPNAFATGRGPRHSSIAATTGLLQRLDREELQAVAGHEMSHVRNYDIRLMLVVTVLAGSVILIADWAGRAFFWGREGRQRRGPEELVFWTAWIVAVILAPVLARIMSMFISRKREFLADASGSELTRNPRALASALEKISAYDGPSRGYSRGNGYLWIATPRRFRAGWAGRLFSSHPPVEERIKRLNGMAYV